MSDNKIERVWTKETLVRALQNWHSDTWCYHDTEELADYLAKCTRLMTQAEALETMLNTYDWHYFPNHIRFVVQDILKLLPSAMRDDGGE